MNQTQLILASFHQTIQCMFFLLVICFFERIFLRQILLLYDKFGCLVAQCTQCTMKMNVDWLSFYTLKYWKTIYSWFENGFNKYIKYSWLYFVLVYNNNSKQLFIFWFCYNFVFFFSKIIWNIRNKQISNLSTCQIVKKEIAWLKIIFGNANTRNNFEWNIYVYKKQKSEQRK